MSSPTRSETIPEDRVLESPAFTGEYHEHYSHLLTLPHRRVRTLSENERISRGETYKGTIESFCRNKGHGFIKPDDGSEPLFLHISDIEGDWVPKQGDRVNFKKLLVPPKMQKYQAVHVHFVHLNENVRHEHWDDQTAN